MVRTASDRINKYAAKIVGDVVKNRIDAQKDLMVTQVNAKFPELVDVEGDVAAYTDPLGISPMLKPFYMSYARKIYKLTKKHTFETLHDEACIATVAWAARGLDLFHLATLCQNIFSIDVWDCTA